MKNYRALLSKVRRDELSVFVFYGLLILITLILHGWSNSSVLVTHGCILAAIGMQVAFWRGANNPSKWARWFCVARDWWPLMAAILVYEAMKYSHAEAFTIALGIEPQDPLMLQVDELLFGNAFPLLLEPLVAPLTVAVSWIVYIFGYAVLPLGVGGYFYASGSGCKSSRETFWVFRRAMILGLLGGFTIYWFVPVAGPLIVMPEAFTVSLGETGALASMASTSLRYPWDCFPSLHTAMPMVTAFVALKYAPRWLGLVALLSAIMIAFTAVYLRFHYGIDVIAGVLWALVVYFVTKKRS